MNLIDKIKKMFTRKEKEQIDEKVIAIMGRNGDVVRVIRSDNQEYDALYRFLTQGSSKPVDSISPGGGFDLDGKRYRYGGKQNSVRESFLPENNDIDSIISMLNRYDKESHHFSSSLNIIRDFVGSGIKIECENQEQEEWINSLSRAIDFEKYFLNTARDFEKHGNIFSIWKYWGESNREEKELLGFPEGSRIPKWIYNISPLNVYVSRHWGEIEVYYKPDQMIEKLSQGNIEDHNLSVVVDIPNNILEAGNEGKYVSMRAFSESGNYDYTYVFNGEFIDEDTKVFPYAYCIMDDIEYERICKDADFNSAMQYKAAVIHIKVGPENPGERDIVLTEDDLKDKINAWKKQASNKMPLFVTDGSVKIEYIVPPIEIFSPDKYTKAVERILDYFGIPLAFLPGQQRSKEGGSYSADYIANKRLRQRIETIRSILGKKMEKILTLWCKENEGSFSGEVYPVKIRYNDNVLKEDKIILEECKFLISNGISPISEVISRMGGNPNEWIRKREEEINNNIPEIIYPYYEKSEKEKKDSDDNEDNKNEGERPSDDDDINRNPRS